jgi:hypothetical protein
MDRSSKPSTKLISYIMDYSITHLFVTILCVLSVLGCCSLGANAQLSPNFYGARCPRLQIIVRDAMRQAVIREPRLGASILRLFFHDCFVNVPTNPIHSFHGWLPFLRKLIYYYSFCRDAMHHFYSMTRPPSQAKRMLSPIEILLGVSKLSTPLKLVSKLPAMLLFLVPTF